MTGKYIPGAIVLAVISFTLRAEAPLTFEIASVKPTGVCPQPCGIIRPTVGNQGYHAAGMSLRIMMTVAYSVTDRQISGGPAWMSTDRFDIDAKDVRPHSIDELHTMLQRLLEERFHLKVRHETREETVWNLVEAKGGSKLVAHDPEDKDYPPMGAQLVKSPEGACVGLKGTNVTVNYLAFTLARNVGRTVVDKTGLAGRYDVNLQFMPDGVGLADGTPLPVSPDCGDVFSALTKQLGLRLEAGKGPAEYLVVERAEKPTAN